jgi:hypothetical protein
MKKAIDGQIGRTGSLKPCSSQRLYEAVSLLRRASANSIRALVSTRKPNTCKHPIFAKSPLSLDFQGGSIHARSLAVQGDVAIAKSKKIKR